MEAKIENLPTGLVTGPIFFEHEGNPYERKERLDAIGRKLESLSLFPIAPRKATLKEVALCHTQEWIEQAQKEILEGREMFTTGDTYLSPRTFEVALWAVGAVLEAVDAVTQKIAKNVFCLIRPPGHHAASDKSGGYCVFNNVAIGARYAQQHGFKKILIVDWDVHQGDGTHEIFEKDPSVFYFGIHEAGNYPCREKPAVARVGDHIVNVALPGEEGVREKVLQAFEEQLVPAMERFQPDFVFISAGFDSRVEDTLGGMDLTDDDFTKLTCIVKEIANKYADGRLVSALEGGYNLEGIALAGQAHVKALTEG